MNTVVLVCCHQKNDVKNDGIYKPIHVGKSLSRIELSYKGDNTGDNISNKNKNYCELTGLYWAWKNLKNIDYIGLCHYRRYFKIDESKFFNKDLYIYPTSCFSSQMIKDLDPNIILNKTDIILAKPKYYPYSLKVDYEREHISKDYETLKRVVNDLYPDYIDAFIDIMEKNNKLSHYNMFFTKWDIFDDYCSWLFNILKEVEARVDISSYDSIQSRIYGYMGERLLNVYTSKNKLRTKHLSVLWFTDTRKDKSSLKYAFHSCKRTIIFNLFKLRKEKQS